MNVSEAVKARTSIRAFTNEAVPENVIRDILEVAKFAPSGGNLQPWRIHVVTGQARDRLVETVKKAIADNPFANESELAVYPEKLWEPYRTRRFEVGEAMYDLLAIPREDKPARLMHLARNFEFFGAPVGLFFSLDRRFDKGQWAHLGMLMQTIALVALEKGYATCMQEAWQTRAKTVSEFLGLSEDEQLYCGMALGRASDEAVNRLRSARAPLEEFVTFIDTQRPDLPRALTCSVCNVAEDETAVCTTCGNEYDKSIDVMKDGKTYRFDGFECASGFDRV